MDPLILLRSTRALADGVEPFLAVLEGAAGFDASAYAERLEIERLMPWVEPAVLSAEGQRRLAPPLVAVVAAGQERRRRRHQELVAETLEVQDAFDRAGIPCRHLKGLSFGLRFFPDPRRRHQRDVDVLVRARDRDAAFGALERVGYTREPGQISEGVVRWGMHRDYAAVDVHWNLRRRSRRRVEETELMARPVRFELEGRALETLSDDATLAFLLLSLCGELRRGACKIRQLLDLHLVLRGIAPSLDAEAFLLGRQRQHLAMPCVNVLAVFLALWETQAELPAVAAAVLRRGRLVQIRGANDALSLLMRAGRSPENERWFRRVYPYDPLEAWTQRLTSDLPFTLSRLLPSRRFRLGRARRAPGATTEGA